MKLHKLISNSWIAVFMLLLSACSKDFLNKNPLDQISSETFWKSEADVQMAVTGCYARLKGSFLDYQRGYLEGLSDNGFVHWGLYGIENMTLGNISAASGGVKNDIYSSSYRGISQCNFFLGNIDKATTVAPAVISKAMAEVKFLRALFYFDLATCFGDIPLYKDAPENAETSKVAKSTRADVFTFIHEDLDYAIANLPDDAYTDGHAVKGSAMALKTRLLLTEEKWEDAANLSEEIIDGGKFSISNDYPGMFTKAAQSGNNEIMFSCVYLSPESYHSVYGMNIEYNAHIFLTKELKDAFECSDGLPITESPLYDPANTFKNRDPRHNYIVRNPVGTDWEGGHYPYNAFDPTGVKNRKYIDTTLGGDYAAAPFEDWDFILIRYADVLLMYAEARNEASGPDASVYNAINEVRERPGVNMPPVDQAKYNTKEKLREYIRHERQVELAVEGIRYFDLKRWKIAPAVLSVMENPGGASRVFEQKHYFWPFAQSELDNNPNLVQTTGY